MVELGNNRGNNQQQELSSELLAVDHTRKATTHHHHRHHRHHHNANDHEMPITLSATRVLSARGRTTHSRYTRTSCCGKALCMITNLPSIYSSCARLRGATTTVQHSTILRRIVISYICLRGSFTQFGVHLTNYTKGFPRMSFE